MSEMGVRIFDYPHYRWEVHRSDEPSIETHLGPERVANDPDPEVKPRPVGFLADIKPLPKVTEPLTWEGDDA